MHHLNSGFSKMKKREKGLPHVMVQLVAAHRTALERPALGKNAHGSRAES